MVEQTDDQKMTLYAKAIVNQTLNGIVLFDKNECIYFVNPAFRKMFQCENENIIGKKVKLFVHSNCFERIIKEGRRLTVKEESTAHSVSFRAGLFPIEGENLYCGIFIDISDEERTKAQYREIRAQTLTRARKVISGQMQTAQEIARLLGETTADTKVLLVKLMSLFEKEV
jgi:PAS domain S-box-containing protein